MQHLPCHDHQSTLPFDDVPERIQAHTAILVLFLDGLLLPVVLSEVSCSFGHSAVVDFDCLQSRGSVQCQRSDLC